MISVAITSEQYFLALGTVQNHSRELFPLVTTSMFVKFKLIKICKSVIDIF